MTMTPQPITEHSDTMSDRSPIGTRYADEDGTYTLVAYLIDPHAPRYARPVLVADDDLTNPPSHPYDRIANGDLPLLYPEDVCGLGSETLEVAPDDPEMTAKARAAAVKQYQARPYRDTGEFNRVMAFDDLTTDEELAAFINFAAAELELRQAQQALEKASRTRAEHIARIADLKGSQQAAARTLGVNQSTVSRALRERPELP
ncbi:hypothetical protein [Streptomyces olivaceoviridis]|uniref:hypothetical protein n=1 Tax=Streptomyces olivaceoviridis TaxID=1921 RepID=UPI003702C244